MSESSKALDGLILLDATRLSISNYSPTEHSITINGKKLSYREVDLGPLQITATQIKAKDTTDNKYYEVLHQNSQIVVQQEQGAQAGKIKEGQIIPAGNNLFLQQSPAPFCFIDTSGRLGSANMWNNLFVANVMGYVDVDKGVNTYKHGLVPEGSSVHGGLFLRKDGQWGQPSVHTGSVSETFLSLQDTPATYTGEIDKYLRVSYNEGGSVVFDALNTSKVPESTNLYYTDARVNTRVTTMLQDSSLTNITVSGTVTCNEILAQSDARLKHEIKGMCTEQCLENVLELEPKTYKFVGKDKTRYGLVAQEVEAVIPELVGSKGGNKAVNYMELVPFLIGAVQQLKQEIEWLRHDTESQIKSSLVL
jgi:hypothetical protein